MEKTVAVHLAGLKYIVDRSQNIVSNPKATTEIARIYLTKRIPVLKEEISSLKEKYDEIQLINFPVCKLASKVTTTKIPLPEGISMFLRHLDQVVIKEFFKGKLVEQTSEIT